MTRSSSPAPHASAPRRRTVLRAASWTLGSVTAGTVTLGGLSACTSTSAPPAEQDASRTDPDVALLEQVSEATRALLNDVEHAIAASPSPPQAESLSALAACLGTQASRLSPGQSAPSTSPTPSAAPKSARELRSAAESHVAVLSDAAGQAESGAFARLLACAAAGVVQHLPAVSKEP